MLPLNGQLGDRQCDLRPQIHLAVSHCVELLPGLIYIGGALLSKHLDRSLGRLSLSLSLCTSSAFTFQFQSNPTIDGVGALNRGR